MQTIASELPALPTVRGYIRGGKVVDLPCIYRRGVWAVVHPWDSRLERVSTVALILLHVPTGLGPGTTHLWTADDRDDAINKVRTLHERYPDFAADAQLGDRPDIPPELVRLIFDSEEYA